MIWFEREGVGVGREREGERERGMVAESGIEGDYEIGFIRPSIYRRDVTYYGIWRGFMSVRLFTVACPGHNF
jgi:hypothetical protein